MMVCSARIAVACAITGWCTHASGQPLVVDGSIHARLGSAAAPFIVESLPEVRSTYEAYAIIAEAGVAPIRGWRFGTRIAIATSSVEQPAGSYTADYTLGNPELHADRALSDRLALRLALGVPLARHDPMLVRDRVLAASDAVEGWRDRELFQPSMLPITATASAAHDRVRWSARAQLKLPLLIRISSTGLPDDAHGRPIALLPVVQAAFDVRATRWLRAGLAIHATAALPAPVAPVRGTGRDGWFQLGAAPRAAFMLGRVELGVELLAALGGPLDGSFGVGFDVRARL